ncbi:MAG: cytochrome c [Bacteroidota bacterium]|nr:cytochrome c [Bacteroidota bacterium]
MGNESNLNKQQKIEEEIDFQKVLKTPGRWFGLVYPYFFTIFLIGGIYFVDSMNTAYHNNIAPVLTDSTNIFNDIAKPVKESTSNGVDQNIIKKPPQNLIDKGKTLFQQNCASCHGQNGMGDGPASVAFNPKPRNFHANEGWKNGRRVTDMLTTLQKGIPGSGMPAFEYLQNEDKIALISYLRTFANDFPPVTDQEVSQLDKSYNLSQGMQTQNQIPVSRAIEIVSEDAIQNVRSINQAISYIKNNPNDTGVKLLERVSSNEQRVLSYLSKSKSWSGSVDDLIRTASSTLDVNGFNAEIVNLNGNEWNELFSFLKKLNLTAISS